MSISWRYFLTDADGTLVNSEGGFATEAQALEAGNRFRKKFIPLTPSPDTPNRIHVLTTRWE